MKNRLQFKKHEENFSTREDALAYIMDNTISLLAEPMVVTYGDNSEEPSAIIAIGAKTNVMTSGSTGLPSYNQYTIIDVKKIDETFDEMDEKIEAIAKSLTIVPLSSDTINMFSEKTESGTVVSGDVKVALEHRFDDCIKPDSIITTPDGIFLYVNLEFDEENDILTFTVNGECTDFQLHNNYVVSGIYLSNEEAIHLKRKEGDDIVIDVKDLIEEWVTEDEASTTPIVLTRERNYGTGKDVLRGSIRITNSVEEPRNVLKFSDDGEALEVIVSDDDDNIIVKDYNEGGLFANVDLSYIASSNTLVFYKTNEYTQDNEKIKTIQLQGVNLFTSVSYDPVTEEIVLKYIDNTGAERETRIPIGGLLDEWETDNSGHTVELSIDRSVSGKSKLSGDVKVSEKDSNILEVDEHSKLYVSGTQIEQNKDDIEAISGRVGVIDAKLDNAIEQFIDKDEELEDMISGVNTSLSNEVIRATSAETQITNALTAATHSLHDEVAAEETRATSAETALQTAINQTNSALTSESNRAISAETANASGISALDSRVSAAENNIQNVSAATENEITRAQNQEAILSGKVDTLSGHVATAENNIAALDTALTEERLRAQEAEGDLATGLTEAKGQITALTSRATSAESRLTTVESGLTDEINRATVKDTQLEATLGNEITRATQEDARLAALIEAGTYTFSSTNTVKLTNESNNVSADLKISNKEGNIITIDGTAAVPGLFASTELHYDPTTNQLWITTSAGEGQKIPLNAGSIVDSIVYDDVHKNIIITYTDTSHNQHEVIFGVEEIFNEWEIKPGQDTGTALHLEKEPGTSGGPDLLSGRVLISPVESNLITMDTNGLFLDGTQITAATTGVTNLMQRVGSLEGEVDDLERDVTILSAVVGTYDSQISNMSSQVTGMNNRMTVIEGEQAGILSNIRQNAQDIADEVNRAEREEAQLDTKISLEISNREDADEALQGQITQNKLKTYSDNSSIVLVEDASGNGTYIKVGSLDPGYFDA